ncbi:hypothetical protein IC229_33170 [Spirosoma sp. BT702]|uniref:Uncharacterized protein n=1 Tax=Spirosoma profusum TaxID=2771354 RepID=A0A927AW36_9BACT|nr:hypothetical protein [Spirosoma profusum]MBD2705510.1 hypothetical protein [Spirosoma profusum]
MEDTPESAARLEAVQRAVFEQPAPMVLMPGDEENAAERDKKAMESLFSALEERGVSNPKKLSEFELYARLEEYQKQAKRERD